MNDRGPEDIASSCWDDPFFVTGRRLSNWRSLLAVAVIGFRDVISALSISELFAAIVEDLSF